MCSVSNEAVLKALFKYKEEELTFAKTIAVAMETEEAAKVAKETVYGTKTSPVHKVDYMRRSRSPDSGENPTSYARDKKRDFPLGTCPRCGKSEHRSPDCPFRDATCRQGHRSGSSTTAVSSHPGKLFMFEIDTSAGDNFCSEDVWCDLGKPPLSPATGRYEVANGQPLPTLGIFSTIVTLPGEDSSDVRLQVNISALMGLPSVNKQSGTSTIRTNFSDLKPDLALQKACEQLCREFSDLFKPELGCLKDFQLEVKFKPDAKPIFCKPRVVPFAIQENLCQAYDAGIARGVWLPTQFNDYGTTVVPIQKAHLPGQSAKLRICGNYSVTVNQQLEPHRHPMPLPEDLMRKLGGGHGFTKIDLADAYNQIMLAPESQRRLALSTHREVLLPTRLPFGISSAPGYFQEMMDQLTSDLQGVAVYMDDILVSGTTTQSTSRTFVLSSNAWRKRDFAAAWRSVYSHNLLSSTWDTSYLNRELPRVLKKAFPGAGAFQILKDLLCTDTILVHFNPTLPIGISCDASEVGLGAVLFHRYSDGSERPIANASKTLTNTQQGYNHKPLIALFGPTPALAANRLARWALMLSQYQYSIEYRKTSDHGNADALSRLLVGPDANFDGEEGDADVDTVCTIKTVSLQLKPTDPGTLAKESAKDPIISNVMRYTREGWPPKGSTNEGIYFIPP
eukprot:Em0393g2a